MRLSREHRAFIVQRLARYDAPGAVRDAFQARFGEEVSLSQISYYDPTNAQGSRDLAQEWRELFEETRRRFREDLAEIAVAQKAYRLRQLDRIFRELYRMRNYRAALRVLEQAAKEMGGAYTNQKHVDMTSDGFRVKGVNFMPPGADGP